MVRDVYPRCVLRWWSPLSGACATDWATIANSSSDGRPSSARARVVVVTELNRSATGRMTLDRVNDCLEY